MSVRFAPGAGVSSRQGKMVMYELTNRGRGLLAAVTANAASP